MINGLKEFVQLIIRYEIAKCSLFGFFLLLIMYSCESNIKEVQNIYKTTFVATGEADSIHLKYTDSGKSKIYVAKFKMLDYSSAKIHLLNFLKECWLHFMMQIIA